MKTTKNWGAGIISLIALIVVAVALCVALVGAVHLVLWLLCS